MSDLPLDLDLVRAQFPAFAGRDGGDAFFENAGGSFACRQTIDALTAYYTDTKVQPYSAYATSAAAGAAMDRARTRWAAALGVAETEVVFGPSTSANAYVLAAAFGELLGPGDEVIVTNQDHEANTGAIRRVTQRAGATLIEWRIDPHTGLLDTDELASLITSRTRLVTVPHASNVIGQENDVAAVCVLAHDVGARVVVDGVAFAPHGLPDIAAIDADVYLFSLYKTYSVHQGLMVARNGLLDELPNQGHFFNADQPSKRLNPAGPDHAQVAAAGAVLDYVELLDQAHEPAPAPSLGTACRRVAARWQAHEDGLTALLLGALAEHANIRILGAATVDDVPGHRCPTIAFVPRAERSTAVAQRLIERGIKTNSGHFYAWRVLDALGIDPEVGVVRLSFVHYTSRDDVERAVAALAP
ncbi:MAG: aminotransferase class V-fold PLP-dependent enzyme [Actinomycetota bacterium]